MTANRSIGDFLMNIELHGFLPDVAQRVMMDIWVRIGGTCARKEAEDCVVTIAESRSYNYHERNQAFVRVYSDVDADFELACQILKPVEMPGADPERVVEFVKLAGCRKL
jgi:hypothetical protein